MCQYKINRSADRYSDTPVALTELLLAFVQSAYGQVPSALGAGVRMVSVTEALSCRVGPMILDMKGMKTLCG